RGGEGRELVGILRERCRAGLEPGGALVGRRLAVGGECRLGHFHGRLDARLAGFVDVPDRLPVLRAHQIEADRAGGGVLPRERGDGGGLHGASSVTTPQPSGAWLSWPLPFSENWCPLFRDKRWSASPTHIRAQ